MTVQGAGSRVTIVNGNGIDRVFQVLGGANAVFSGLTIEGGVARDDGTAGAQRGSTEAEGGGILVQDGGHVTLSRVWLSGNQAIGGRGAAGFVTGILSYRDRSIRQVPVKLQQEADFSFPPGRLI